jgi:hypothetical protein
MMQDNETVEIADLEYEVGGVHETEACDAGKTEGWVIYYVPPV